MHHHTSAVAVPTHHRTTFNCKAGTFMTCDDIVCIHLHTKKERKKERKRERERRKEGRKEGRKEKEESVFS